MEGAGRLGLRNASTAPTIARAAIPPTMAYPSRAGRPRNAVPTLTRTVAFTTAPAASVTWSATSDVPAVLGSHRSCDALTDRHPGGRPAQEYE